MLSRRLPTTGRVFCVGNSCRKCCGIGRCVLRRAIFGRRLCLGMLAGDTAEGDGCETVDKVASFLLHRLALVIFRRAGCAVMATQNTRLRLLNAARLPIYKGNWGWRE